MARVGKLASPMPYAPCALTEPGELVTVSCTSTRGESTNCADTAASDREPDQRKPR